MIELSTERTLQFTLALAGTSSLVQALETLWIRPSWQDDRGIWRWNDLQPEFKNFPRILRSVLAILLSENGFTLLNVARAVASLLLLWQPTDALVSSALWVALTGSVLSALRWRGAFNGGSDSMTLVVLLPLAISRLPWPDAALATRIALAYIALQSLLSYFIAGVVKVVEANWRDGRALGEFLGNPQYGVPSAIQRLVRRPFAARFLAWSVLAFELLAPALVLTPATCLTFLAVAALFHTVNARVLGLNRFVFAWISTYPAILFLAHWRAETP
jgi:hypothetical protein